MVEQAKLKVVNNAYKIEAGEFHSPEPNIPIRNEAGKLCGITNPRRLVHIHSYGKEAPFFEGLTEGKLLGTRCDNDECEYKGTIHLPFRICCPDCLGDNNIVDLTDAAKKTGKIYSYIVTSRTGAFNTLDIPIRFIDVEIDGVATVLKSYQLAGEPEIGQRVMPIFRTKEPTYTIMDLAWVTEGTKESELPEGFTF